MWLHHPLMMTVTTEANTISYVSSAGCGGFNAFHGPFTHAFASRAFSKHLLCSCVLGVGVTAVHKTERRSCLQETCILGKGDG